MPKVPTLESQRILDQPIKMGRLETQQVVNPKQIERVQNVVNDVNDYRDKVMAKERKKADDLKLTEADAKLSALETRMLYDPKTGAMNKRGKDSFGLEDSVLPDFDSQIGDIEKELTSDYQKLSFKKMVANRRGFIDRQLQRHVSAETKKYDDDVTKSYIQNEMNAAIENFHDPERIKLSLDRQKGSILAYADRNGMDPETKKKLLEETTSKTHSAVFSKILNGGGVSIAQNYYKQNRDEITGEDRVKIDKALREGIIDRDANLATEQIMANHGDNMKDALAAARAKFPNDTEKQDEAVRRVKQRFADNKAADKMVSDERYESAYKIMEANGFKVEAVPRALWADLQASEKEALKKLTKGAVTTDWDTYYNLRQMAVNPVTRNKFKQTNLTRYFHKLDDPERKELIKLQTAANNKNNQLLDGIQTQGSIVTTVMLEAGINPTEKTDVAQIKRANKFRQEVDSRIVQKQAETGRKATNEEVRQISNDLMREVLTKEGGWFGWGEEKKRIFELEPGDKPMVRIEDIPKSEADMIRAHLIKKGLPSTDEDVKKKYSDYLNSIRGQSGS